MTQILADTLVRLDEELRAADKFNAVYLHHSKVPLAEAHLDDAETATVVRQRSLGMCFV